MAKQCCTGAMMKCSFGLAPSTLVATPKMVKTSMMDAANIMDHIPFTNIPPFGMCQSPSNPAFVAATSAAMGTPTPVPCTPATAAPWAPGSPTVKVVMFPALNDSSKLVCSLGGMIEISMAGQMTHNIP